MKNNIDEKKPSTTSNTETNKIKDVDVEPVPALKPSKCVQDIRNLVNIKIVQDFEKIFGNNQIDVEIPCEDEEINQRPIIEISDFKDLVHVKIANLDQLNLDFNT